MKAIPASIDAVLADIRALGSFSSWSGSSVLTIEQVKTYCVPGNAKGAKGRQAIWVRGPAAKRPRILFPELVLRAMRHIAEPTRRGSRQELVPSSFAELVTGADAKLPGIWTNHEIYLALARRLLGLPDDHVDETTERIQAERQATWDARHPDIRTAEGLMQEILLAYVEVLYRQEPDKKPADWVDLAYRALFSRHGTWAWTAEEARRRHDLAEVLDEIRTEPGHADIRDIDLAVFAMLYAHGLCMCGKIRESAVTAAVNTLADMADDGVLKDLKRRVEQEHAAELASFAKLFQGARMRRRTR